MEYVKWQVSTDPSVNLLLWPLCDTKDICTPNYLQLVHFQINHPKKTCQQWSENSPPKYLIQMPFQLKSIKCITTCLKWQWFYSHGALLTSEVVQYAYHVNALSRRRVVNWPNLVYFMKHRHGFIFSPYVAGLYAITIWWWSMYIKKIMVNKTWLTRQNT